MPVVWIFPLPWNCSQNQPEHSAQRLPNEVQPVPYSRPVCGVRICCSLHVPVLRLRSRELSWSDLLLTFDHLSLQTSQLLTFMKPLSSYYLQPSITNSFPG